MMVAFAISRRSNVWNLLVFVLILYTAGNFWYACNYTVPHPAGVPLQNASWWKTYSEPYDISMLKGINDFPRLFDMDDFEFLINNRRCDGDDSLFLVVFVHSAPTHFLKREAIRQTWGNETNLLQDRMRVVFMLGTVTDFAVQRRIAHENIRYRDIIQGNFFDSYRNLTYKHVMGLKWVTYFCRQARFVFKADDDIFVDVYQLVNYLKGNFGATKVGNLMMCYLIKSPYVKRSRRSKWYVSFRDYPERYFPSYCPGWVIIMSSDVVFQLYLLTSKVPFFWVDDVYVSGILFGKLGVPHFDLTVEHLTKSNNIYRWLNSQELSKPYLFGPTEIDTYTIFRFWNKTIQYYKLISR